MANVFCTKCGGRLVPNAKFCTKCGAPVVSLQSSGTLYNHDAQPAAPQSAYSEVYTPVPQTVVPEVCEPVPQTVVPEDYEPVPQNVVSEVYEPVAQDVISDEDDLLSRTVTPGAYDPLQELFGRPVEPAPQDAAPEVCEPVPQSAFPDGCEPAIQNEITEEYDPLSRTLTPEELEDMSRTIAPEPYAPLPRAVIPEVYESAPQNTYPPVGEPAPQNAYPPASEPAPQAAKKPKPARRGVFRTILAILLCISMFGVICVTSVVGGLQYAASEPNLKVLSENLTQELYDLLDVVPASFFIPDVGEDITLTEFFIEFALENGLSLNRRGIGEILESSQFVETISDHMIAYLCDIRDGTKKAVMDEWALEEWLRSGRQVLEDVLNAKISDSDLEETVEVIASSGVLELTNARLLEQNVPGVYYTIRYSLSIWLLCILIVLVLLHMTLLTAANRWNMTRTVLDCGITFTVAGVLIALPAGILPATIDGLMGSIPFFGEVVGIIVTYLIDSFMLGGLIALCLGVLLIIIGVVMHVINSKRRELQQA